MNSRTDTDGSIPVGDEQEYHRKCGMKAVLAVRESHDSGELEARTFQFSSRADAETAQELLVWATRGADPDPVVTSDVAEVQT